MALERFHAEALPNHVLGRPVNGTPASVARITDGDIKAHHSRLLARDNLHVVYWRHRSRNRHRRARPHTRRASGTRHIATVTEIKPRVLPQPVVVDRVLPATTAVFVLPSLEQSDPDYPALQVLSHILASGDFDSRQTEEIRVRRGLAYSVQARLTSEASVPLLLGGLTTRNETMGETLGVLREVLGYTASDKPTFEAFAMSSCISLVPTSWISTLMQGWHPNVARQACEARCQLCRWPQFYHRAADVRRVADRVLRTDRLIVTIVGRPTLDR